MFYCVIERFFFVVESFFCCFVLFVSLLDVNICDCNVAGRNGLTPDAHQLNFAGLERRDDHFSLRDVVGRLLHELGDQRGRRRHLVNRLA